MGSSKRTVYLVGTAHISPNSAKDVANAIELARPDTVMVELCGARAKRLRSGEKGQEFSKLVNGLINNVFGGRAGANFGSEFLLKAGLSGMYSLLRFYGLDPGAEFKTALQEADRRKLNVCHGDRDVDETIRLLRDAISQISLASLTSAPEPPQELKHMSGSLDIAGSIEALKNRQQIAIFRNYMEGVFPDLMQVMVHQRDAIMVDNLLQACKPGCVVAVVGMA